MVNTLRRRHKLFKFSNDSRIFDPDLKDDDNDIGLDITATISRPKALTHGRVSRNHVRGHYLRAQETEKNENEARRTHSPHHRRRKPHRTRSRVRISGVSGLMTIVEEIEEEDEEKNVPSVAPRLHRYVVETFKQTRRDEYLCIDCILSTSQTSSHAHKSCSHTHLPTANIEVLSPVLTNAPATVDNGGLVSESDEIAEQNNASPSMIPPLAGFTLPPLLIDERDLLSEVEIDNIIKRVETDRK